MAADAFNAAYGACHSAAAAAAGAAAELELFAGNLNVRKQQNAI